MGSNSWTVTLKLESDFTISFSVIGKVCCFHVVLTVKSQISTKLDLDFYSLLSQNSIWK